MPTPAPGIIEHRKWSTYRAGNDDPIVPSKDLCFAERPSHKSSTGDEDDDDDGEAQSNEHTIGLGDRSAQRKRYWFRSLGSAK